MSFHLFDWQGIIVDLASMAGIGITARLIVKKYRQVSPCGLTLGQIALEKVHGSVKFHAARRLRCTNSSRAWSSCRQVVARGLRCLTLSGKLGSSTMRPGARTRP